MTNVRNVHTLTLNWIVKVAKLRLQLESTKAFSVCKHHQGLLKEVNQAYIKCIPSIYLTLTNSEGIS